MAKLFAFLFVAFLVCNVLAQQPRSANDFYERGVERHRNGDFDGAIADFTMEIELTSRLGKAKKELLNNSATGQGVVHGAFVVNIRVIDPRTAGAYISRGNSYLAKYQIERAIEDYNRALTIWPGMKEAYICRGSAHILAMKYDAAVQDFSKALKIDSKYVKALIGRGIAKLDRGDKAALMEDFDLAVRLEPKNYETWYHRGDVKRSMSDNAGALADFERAIQLEPDKPMPYLGRAAVRMKLRQFETAIQDLKRAISLDERLGPGYRDLGYLYYAMGKLDEAEKYFAKALELAPWLRQEIEANKRRLDISRR